MQTYHHIPSRPPTSLGSHFPHPIFEQLYKTALGVRWRKVTVGRRKKNIQTDTQTQVFICARVFQLLLLCVPRSLECVSLSFPPPPFFRFSHCQPRLVETRGLCRFGASVNPRLLPPPDSLVRPSSLVRTPAERPSSERDLAEVVPMRFDIR